MTLITNTTPQGLTASDLFFIGRWGSDREQVLVDRLLEKGKTSLIQRLARRIARRVH